MLNFAAGDDSGAWNEWYDLMKYTEGWRKATEGIS